MSSRGETPGSARAPVAGRRAFDGLVLVLLLVVAYMARRGSLPSDGLWFDDSWVAAGVLFGHVRSIMETGSGTPGFSLLLMAVHALGGGSLHDLGVPSLVAGVVGPPVLYLVLRGCTYSRAVAALVSAALVVARIPILYSGRVKGYTFDLLWVLLLTIALPRLAARTWRWPLGLAWLVGASIVATFSGYTLVAVTGAAVILVLHPSDDRNVRLGAVAAQGVFEVVFFALSEKASNLTDIERTLQIKFDAHIDFSLTHLRFLRSSFGHLERVVQVFPGGHGAWLGFFGLVALAGLVIASVRAISRAESIVARFLLLLVVIAYVGSALHKFPFGPVASQPISSGGRYMLWLVPAFAVGLAAAGHRVRALLARVGTTVFPETRIVLDGAIVVAAVVLVVVTYKAAPPAPFPGSASATAFIDTNLRPNDAVFLTPSSTYAFADTTSIGVHLVKTPTHQVGFAPAFSNPAIHIIGPWAASPPTTAEVRQWATRATRVIVDYGGVAVRGQATINDPLRQLGYHLAMSRTFKWSVIEIWTRGPRA